MPEITPAGFTRDVFPVWVVVDLEAEAEHGESHATYYVRGDVADEVVLPLFTTEDAAAAYIGNKRIDRHAPAPIADPTDLYIRLEQFRTRGGRYVAFDAPDGPPPGTFLIELGPFIEHVRDI